MKIKANVSLKGMKKEINRIIQFSDQLTMKLFCEYIIVSMNGNCKHLYQLIYNDEYAYLGPDCQVQDYEIEELMEEKKVEYLELKSKDKLMLNYDFANDWEFDIKIISVTDEQCDKDFEVISGCGCGIIEDVWGVMELKRVPEMDEKLKEYYAKKVPGYIGYDMKNFDKDEINLKIEEYLDEYREVNKPKRYEMNVALEFFEKEIQRKIVVDSNVNLDRFCRMIIYSMRGDMSHGYGLKRGKEYIDEEILECRDLNFLELKVNQRLKVTYDWGDSWNFAISVRKILDGYGNKRFEVIKGKGYGIIDDCGGTYELNQIFNGENTDWGEYDINDFELNEINKIIDIHF